VQTQGDEPESGIFVKKGSIGIGKNQRMIEFSP